MKYKIQISTDFWLE